MKGAPQVTWLVSWGRAQPQSGWEASFSAPRLPGLCPGGGEALSKHGSQQQAELAAEVSLDTTSGLSPSSS